MNEEEFVALLKLEGKKLFIDKHNFRTKSNAVKPYYTAIILVPDGKELNEMTDWYRSRAYAIKKLTKIYYENR